MTRRSLFTKLAGLLTILPFVGKAEAQTPRFYRPRYTEVYGPSDAAWRHTARRRARQHGWFGTRVYKVHGQPMWGYEGDHYPRRWDFHRSRYAVLLGRTDPSAACCAYGEMVQICTPAEAYRWVMADPYN